MYIDACHYRLLVYDWLQKSEKTEDHSDLIRKLFLMSRDSNSRVPHPSGNGFRVSFFPPPSVITPSVIMPSIKLYHFVTKTHTVHVFQWVPRGSKGFQGVPSGSKGFKLHGLPYGLHGLERPCLRAGPKGQPQARRRCGPEGPAPEAPRLPAEGRQASY